MDFSEDHGLKIFNKILVNQIQEHCKKITHHDQVGFVPDMWDWFDLWISVNVATHRFNDRNHTIVLIDG